MRTIEGFEKAKKALSRQARRDLEYPQEPAVRKIIKDVRERGDAALFELTEKFDGARLDRLEVSRRQISAARARADKALVAALELAAGRIAAIHELQAQKALHSYTHGKTGWMVRPLDRVGVYTPGGTATYPSSLLMTAVPARVAGVKEVIIATPPGNDGAIPPETLVTAQIAGADRVFAIGGAQAIAALAYGTESVPRVDKICGPGNIYVFLAKKLLYGIVGIDGLWGPSEVVVIADESANPDYCAADMLAQAEHDLLATAIFITTSPQKIKEVKTALERQLKSLSRTHVPRKSVESSAEIARKSLETRGAMVVVRNLDEAIELVNLFAPEHVCLLVDHSDAYVPRIRNAGCIIYGAKATEPMSDYVSGPSHVLPTEGTARFGSPLNVTDFMKITNLSKVGDALMNLAGQAAITIATTEGLDAHARAVELRLKKTRKPR
jgi:histidinol dehydrogenase